MGQLTGDKSRYQRKRRQKLERRQEMRALGATLGTKEAPAKEEKAGRKQS